MFPNINDGSVMARGGCSGIVGNGGRCCCDGTCVCCEDCPMCFASLLRSSNSSYINFWNLEKSVRNSIISLERLVHIPSSKFSDDTDGGDEMLEE